MRAILLIVLVAFIGLVVFSGASNAILSNFGQDAQKLKQNKQYQDVHKLISSISPEPKSNDCDVSYPDICIAPYPPDLDCQDIPYVNFRVTGNDPHRFDSDKDGIGCEK